MLPGRASWQVGSNSLTVPGTVCGAIPHVMDFLLVPGFHSLQYAPQDSKLYVATEATTITTTTTTVAQWWKEDSVRFM